MKYIFDRLNERVSGISVWNFLFLNNINRKSIKIIIFECLLNKNNLD